MATDIQSETLPRRPAESHEGQRDEWVAAVEQVVSDAEAWATEQHWSVHRGPKTITESRLGSYEVPALLIRAPAGRFVLDPIARYIVGAAGEIELSAFPSYESVLIIRNDAGWHFVIERPTLDRPWSKEAFLEIVFELAKNA
jgi:hypothetical protein